MDAGMSAVRQRHQKNESFIVAQKAARLARWLERRARTAEPSKRDARWPKRLRTAVRTYEGGTRSASSHACFDGAGVGSTAW